MKRLIYVYGLAGEEQNYRVIQYTFFDVDLTRDVTIEMHLFGCCKTQYY